jgi:phage shock protein PspC (stress-responsive transcriptional regulator)
MDNSRDRNLKIDRALARIISVFITVVTLGLVVATAYFIFVMRR